MTPRAAVAMLLALALPGAGHVYLGRRERGLAFCAIVVLMFVTGLLVDGGLYTIANSREAAIRLLASYASMGSGLLYLIAYLGGATGVVASATYEQGATFTVTAGLMNLLLVLDSFDIATGRRS